MNPLNMAMNVLKQHPSYDKKNLSDAAIRHKREYDTKYESTPERTKYRTDLKRERRKRNMMGHGGPDLSHTKQGGLVRENVHDNRARNQPGHSLKMLKFTGAGGREPGSAEEQAWWTQLHGLTKPDEGETDAPVGQATTEFPGMMVGDQWASTREEAQQMGGKFLPESKTTQPEVSVVSRPPEPAQVKNKTDPSGREGAPTGVEYGSYNASGRGYHEEKQPFMVDGLHNLKGDDLVAHARAFDGDGHGYMEDIGVPSHHQEGFGKRLHEMFGDRLGRLRAAQEETTRQREHFTQQGIDLTNASDDDVKEMFTQMQLERSYEEQYGNG